jgi:iron complex transport system ATP-binding protein
MEEKIKLKVEGLTFSYDKENVIENICLEVREGAFIGIVGPNGSGKSTILKCIYGGLTPKQGEIAFEGIDTKKLKPKERALILSVVGQENCVPFNFTVREIVAMGRTPHKKLFESDTAEDKLIVEEAMEQVGISSLADRDYSNLSGGEKQRVLIARAMAQKTDFLILDEPTNHLDINYQLQIFRILKRSGLTVLSAIHDLNLAALFYDELYVLNGKEIYTHGTPDEILTVDLIKNVFHVDCAIDNDSRTGKKNIVYIPNAL